MDTLSTILDYSPQVPHRYGTSAYSLGLTQPDKIIKFRIYTELCDHARFSTKEDNSKLRPIDLELTELWVILSG